VFAETSEGFRPLHSRAFQPETVGKAIVSATGLPDVNGIVSSSVVHLAEALIAEEPDVVHMASRYFLGAPSAAGAT